MAGGPELLLNPAHGLGVELRGFFCESAALLMQLRAEAAQWTSCARKLLLVALNAVQETKQPLLRRTQPAHFRFECSDLLQAPLHNGLAQFFLGFEVVVNIADGDVGGFG